MRHVNMRQGVLGLKVKIMETLERKRGKDATTKVMPDFIRIHAPKEDHETIDKIKPGVIQTNYSQGGAAAAPQVPI